MQLPPGENDAKPIQPRKQWMGAYLLLVGSYPFRTPLRDTWACLLGSSYKTPPIKPHQATTVQGRPKGNPSAHSKQNNAPGVPLCVFFMARVARRGVWCLGKLGCRTCAPFLTAPAPMWHVTYQNLQEETEGKKKKRKEGDN